MKRNVYGVVNIVNGITRGGVSHHGRVTSFPSVEVEPGAVQRYDSSVANEENRRERRAPGGNGPANRVPAPFDRTDEANTCFSQKRSLSLYRESPCDVLIRLTGQ